MNFNNYKFKSFINKNLSRIGFEIPTKVQQLVIPRALNGESLIVESATGSGKTHAFLLPILERVDPIKQSIQAVILSPTRELATQLFNVLSQLVKDSNITIAKAIGGENRDSEIKKYQNFQPHIVVGTIGRIGDLVIKSNVLKVHRAKMIVIDEADMIFEEKEIREVDQIIGLIQDNPQFMVFSATVPKGLRQFLNKYLRNIKIIAIEEQNLTTSNINHMMIQIKAKDKFVVLTDLLNAIQPFLALIFVNTKDGVDELAIKLASEGFKVGKLHGDMDDRIRKQTIRRISELEFQYVVASDIASRGIDITGVSHVINYELPSDVEFYIHRCGRTARFDQKGIAYSLYAYEDDNYIKMLQSKGLKPQFCKVVNGQIVETKMIKRNYHSIQKQIESNIHRKIPVPKKVKPGYRKKRNEEIEKTIRQEKRNRINEIYRQKAKRERGKQ